VSRGIGVNNPSASYIQRIHLQMQFAVASMNMNAICNITFTKSLHD